MGAPLLPPAAAAATTASAPRRLLSLRLTPAVPTAPRPAPARRTGNASEFARAVNWVTAHLSFDINDTVSVFETNIRVLGPPPPPRSSETPAPRMRLSCFESPHSFAPRSSTRLLSPSSCPPRRPPPPPAGGLLSAHMLASDPATGFAVDGYAGGLLNLALDLGRRLLPAFDTPTGVPFGAVNLKYGVAEGESKMTSTAGARGRLANAVSLSCASHVNSARSSNAGGVALNHPLAHPPHLAFAQEGARCVWSSGCSAASRGTRDSRRGPPAGGGGAIAPLSSCLLRGEDEPGPTHSSAVSPPALRARRRRPCGRSGASGPAAPASTSSAPTSTSSRRAPPFPRPPPSRLPPPAPVPRPAPPRSAPTAPPRSPAARLQGKWTHRDSGIGTSIDSFYEYLLKCNIFLQEPEYLHMFRQARPTDPRTHGRTDGRVGPRS